MSPATRNLLIVGGIALVLFVCCMAGLVRQLIHEINALEADETEVAP